MSAVSGPETCNCAMVRKAARHVTQLYDRHLAPAALTVTQYGMMARIGREGSLTVNGLAATMAIDRTTLGRNLKPLERDGLVTSKVDARDARRRVLSLTKAGRERLCAARPLWAEAQKSFEASFGSEPSQSLRAALVQLLGTEFGKSPAPEQTLAGSLQEA